MLTLNLSSVEKIDLKSHIPTPIKHQCLSSNSLKKKVQRGNIFKYSKFIIRLISTLLINK